MLLWQSVDTDKSWSITIIYHLTVGICGFGKCLHLAGHQPKDLNALKDRVALNAWRKTIW